MRTVEWEGMTLVFPLVNWDGSTWCGGHYGSGREPSSVVYNPEANGRMHAGYDFGCPYREPLLALAAGTVTDLGYNTGAGNYVTIRHRHPAGFDFWARYLHIDWNGTVVRKGQIVEAGQIIAYAGTTGSSAAVHLHLDLTDAAPYVHWTEGHHIDVEWVLMGTPGRHGGIIMPTTVQKDLQDAGYYAGVIDGIWGPKSHAAYLASEAAQRCGGGGDGPVQDHRHHLTETGGVIR